ncbi:MAG: hypothetical protein OCD02_19660 [Spirochaetaceae bacterium]
MNKDINLIFGDMPGDKISIDESHIKRAEVIYPIIFDKIKESGHKTVISVYGGSGVGKSEIGSLLASELTKNGVKTYVLSGDNYPYRIPKYNDLERLNRFRYAGLLGLKNNNGFNPTWTLELNKLLANKDDFNKDIARTKPFLSIYQVAGEKALWEYLASEKEVDFNLLNSIIGDFKNNRRFINLKRMGRTINDISFEKIDFKDTEVLIIEWTHGNNPHLKGVDYPVFLFSTPGETLSHRVSRGRDKGVNSSFTNCVLEIEQNKINNQFMDSFLIVGKSGNIITKGDFNG